MTVVGISLFRLVFKIFLKLLNHILILYRLQYAIWGRRRSLEETCIPICYAPASSSPEAQPSQEPMLIPILRSAIQVLQLLLLFWLQLLQPRVSVLCLRIVYSGLGWAAKEKCVAKKLGWARLNLEKI